MINTRVGFTFALMLAMTARAAPIHLTPPDGDGPAAVVAVTDARPAWQTTRKNLSLLRTACDFAIVRWGDKDTTPGRARAVAEGLGRHLEAPLRDKPFKLTWFTLHTNRRAPPAHEDSTESGVTYGALHAMECRKGAEMVGGVDADEANQPLPLVIDIVVEVDGRSFASRVAASIPDTEIGSAQLVDEALARLAKSIRDGAPTPTPCERLKVALESAPKDRFYARSHRQYCSP